MRYKIASIAQTFRLPSICSLCNQYHTNKFAICTPCHTLLSPLGPACRHCAVPLPDAKFPVCGLCLRHKPDVDQVLTAYRFEEPLRTLLHEFKYRQGLYLSSFITQLMLDAIDVSLYKTQCLIPVPMHPLRIRQRGFNQAAELAKNLGRKLNLPFDLSGCQKVMNTEPQAGLNAMQRRKNINNTFKADRQHHQHVTLIDDLLTTGSTANELARVLKNNGVAQVDLWCCARA